MELLPFYPAGDILTTCLALLSMLGMVILFLSRKFPLKISIPLCCYTGGLCTFLCMSSLHSASYNILSPPYSLIIPSTLCFSAYTLVHYYLSTFTNWVFFSEKKKVHWALLFSKMKFHESIALCTSFILLCFNTVNLEYTIILTFLWLFLLKFWFFVAIRKLFFPNFLVSIHFLAYLCALEIVPILIFGELLRITVQNYR